MYVGESTLNRFFNSWFYRRPQRTTKRPTGDVGSLHWQQSKLDGIFGEFRINALAHHAEKISG
jgi:hypothetical protein